jgi:leucyl aminopeptidase
MTPEELLKRECPTFTLTKKLEDRKASDILILPVFSEEKPNAPKDWQDEVSLLSGDFKGKEGEFVILYKKGKKETRLGILGLGKKEKLSKRALQKVFSELTKKCQDKEFENIAVALPEGHSLSMDELLESLADGLLLGSYDFPFHRGERGDKKKKVKAFHLLGAPQEKLPLLKEREKIARAVFFSQDLINGNADLVTPTFLGNCAQAIAKKFKTIKVKVWPKKEIEKEGWGLLLAVNQGSPNNVPVVIEASYKGGGKKGSHTLLIGKGITYDTGGLNIKMTGMETMKGDMSGGAITLASMYAAALLELPIQLSLLIPSTENGIGPESYKPGDVYTSYSGKTVEITNTDAEGRLVLADALAWGEKNLKPDLMIDVATLTGACAIALGPDCAGLFTGSDKLADQLLKASQNAGENLWRMPMFDSYEDTLKSYVADFVNSPPSREGSSIIASLFLRKFVGKTPWAHLDIAPCAFTKYASPPYPKHATGYGVRMIVDFLRR